MMNGISALKNRPRIPKVAYTFSKEFTYKLYSKTITDIYFYHELCM